MSSIAIVSEHSNITLSQAVLQAGHELASAGVLEARREAQMLASHAFKVSGVELITNASGIVGQTQLEKFKSLVTRRLDGEPVGRIIGAVEFYGNRFQVTEATLYPRSDTETLVDAVLEEMRDRRTQALRILDIGTGTGVIILSLLHNLPNAFGVACDICAEALKAATTNSETQLVSRRVTFVEAQWCCGIEGKFDVIVSNPPYIRSGVIPTLAREVKNYDPTLALDGGVDGLNAYRRIFSQCATRLKANGKLFLEIGFDQSDAVCGLARVHGWKFLRLEKDISANDRVLVFEVNHSDENCQASTG